MAAGAVDFGLGSGPAMAFTAKGAPVIAVAAFAGAPRNISVVVPADSPIKTVADLKGKLLAVSTAGSLTEWLVKRIGVSEGWGPDGVRAAAIGDAPAQTAAMRAHQVDGYMGSTENGYQLEDLGEARVLVGMERFAPHFITHVIFARRDLVAKDPELVRRFLKGFFGAIAYIRAHKDETTKIAIAVEHESPSVLDKAYDHELPMMQSDGAFDPEGLALIKQSFVEMHILDAAPPDDAILTRQFLPVTP
jgi:NitT/TauT family transport system substrate-binding protein